MAEYFKCQGCELLDEYLGVFEPMDYRCSCGEYATTTWNNFSKGKRCGHCVKYGQKKKRSLQEVQSIFHERGCEFLDSEFKGIHYKHRYRCKCGRECEVTFAAFHFQKQYCKECGLEKVRDRNKLPKNVQRGDKHYNWQPDREKVQLNRKFRKKCYKILASTLQATGKKKVGHTSDMIGYGPTELQEHITAHPNWDAVKDENWHLDHIFPIEAFIKHGIMDVAIINNLDNLQPISQHDNNVKRDKYDESAFLQWLDKYRE